MSRSNFDCAGTEFFINVRISNNRDFTISQRQLQHLADKMLVAVIIGIDGNGLVAEKSFRTGSGNNNAFRTIGCRITNFPKFTFLFFGFNFQIGNGALKLRIPINQTGSFINKAFSVKLNEAVSHCLGELFIHCEIKPVPI